MLVAAGITLQEWWVESPGELWELPWMWVASGCRGG